MLAEWRRLTIAADQVDDSERIRIATENRLRAVATDERYETGPLLAQADALRAVERMAVNELRRAMKAHPLGEWCASQVGVGEKTLGRLLGIIGDPTTRFDPATGEVVERTVAQLRSYCGYGDAAAQVRRRGVRARWSADARKRLYIIADCCMKQTESPYRAVYLAARDKYADATHASECVRCGPSGKPAPAGSPLSDGHKHARALRAVSKAFLKNLWQEARRVHHAVDSHEFADAAGQPLETRRVQDDRDSHRRPGAASELAT